jgi:hypothetical protein
MRKAIIAVGCATALASAVAAAEPAGASPGGASPLNASCGTVGPNLANLRVNDAPVSGAVNQRSGSSTSCSIPGVLQPTDDAIYYCWTAGNDGLTWTYLKNIRTGVLGWSRDDLLKGFGAPDWAWCGF